MNSKTIKRIYATPAKHWVGDGFHVAGMFHYGETFKNIDPFLLMDYASPEYFQPNPNANAPHGVSEHPHRGFETVTIAYQGQVAHKDASGGEGVIATGDVQWMTAGSGVMHEEFHAPEFSKTGGIFEMVQLWVNLPAKDKMTAPRYQAIVNKDIPVVAFDGGQVRVIAGEFDKTTGAASTFSPINLWDVALNAGSEHEFSTPDTHNLLILVRNGQITINGNAAKAGELITFEKSGSQFRIHATTNSELLVLSGEPLNEPITGHGPFVMNTREEIMQAFMDLQNDNFVRIARD